MPLDLKTIEDSDHLLDILVQCEDILDGLDLYVYRNWFSGEVIEGPIIKRHWVTIGLLYPYRKMPDPRASLRLMKHSIIVDFSKVRRHVDKNNPQEKAEEKADHEKDLYWMVEIKFPRRLLKKIEDDVEDGYEDDVDTDDVEEAKDSGVTPEDAYQDEQSQGDFVDPSQQDQLPADPSQQQPQQGF